MTFKTWEFFIWGYQPLQKWLKDRKEKTLTNDEILHFLKMIFVIIETIKLMKNLENLEK